MLKKYESTLTKKEIDYLINFKFTSSQFHCLPKVHKSEIIKNVINTEILNIPQFIVPMI